MVRNRNKFRRSRETFEGGSDFPIEKCELETIDFAVFNFINEKLNIFAETNEGFKKVPVKWVTQERRAQSRNDPEQRDLARTLIYPLITVKRINKLKNARAKGKYYGNIPFVLDPEGSGITLTRRINQEKTSNFANADSRKGEGFNGEVGHGQINFPRRKPNNKIVYETVTIPQPVYFEVPYEIKIVGEYQEQMNDMVQPFIVEAGSVNGVVIEFNGHKFEAYFEEEYSEDNNASEMGEDPRKYETKIALRVYGYLLNAGKNAEGPKVKTRENAVEFKIQRERVIFGDMNEYIDKGKFRG